MLITEKNIDIWYREYLKQYERTKKHVKAQGGKIRDIKPSSKQDFKIDFLSSIGDYPKLSGTKLAEKMAKDELYDISWKQAKSRAQAYAEMTGERMSLNLIQRFRLQVTRYEGELNRLIRERKRELQREGRSRTETNLIISSEFFGSE